MTPQEKKLFEFLGDAETGKVMIGYLKKVQDAICDSRNWKEGDTRESTTKAAEYIEFHIISKIVRQNKKKEIDRNEYI